MFFFGIHVVVLLQLVRSCIQHEIQLLGKLFGYGIMKIKVRSSFFLYLCNLLHADWLAGWLIGIFIPFGRARGERCVQVVFFSQVKSIMGEIVVDIEYQQNVGWPLIWKFSVRCLCAICISTG